MRGAVEDLRAGAVSNGETAVVLVIFRQPGVNIIDTVDRIREELPYLRALVPAEITLRPVLDQTVTIRASVKKVSAHSLRISIGLVVLVVFLFLQKHPCDHHPGRRGAGRADRHLRVMYLVGYRSTPLLMALTVATGFVVDDHPSSSRT